MQKFSKQSHENFKKYFKIKKNPSKIEMYFLKKSEKYLNFIRFLPGIKMIGIGNSISMNCATRNSDIDLFIVTTKYSMWFNRIFITFFFQVIGLRKNSKKHAGRFCLSFFSTIKGLDFSSFKVDNDIYLYFWIVYLKPIVDYGNTYDLFIKKNKSWADFSKYDFIINNNKKYIKYKKYISSDKDNFIIRKLNTLFKVIFLPKTINSYNKLGKPFGVIINDDLLKFHDKDIRNNIKKYF